MKFSPAWSLPPSRVQRLLGALQRAWVYIRHRGAPVLRAGLTAAALRLLQLMIGGGRRRR